MHWPELYTESETEIITTVWSD